MKSRIEALLAGAMKGYGAWTVRLWLVLTLFAMASLSDVMEFASREPYAAVRIAGMSLYAIFKASVLTFGYLLCRRVRWLKLIAATFIGLFMLMSLVNAVSHAFYGFGITRKLMTILYETNLREVTEFLPNLLHQFGAALREPYLWGGLAVLLLLWVVLPRIPRRIFLPAILTLSFGGGVYLLITFATAEYGKSDHLISVRTTRCLYEAIRDTRNIRELLSRRRPLPDAATAHSDFAAARITVVIGESASRDHLSLYGYALPTTPRLDTIAEGLYAFSDAIGASPTTAANLPRLLTFMTDEPGDGEWYEYPTILQLFKAMGYATTWLSNQERTGKWSNLSGILINDADVLRYLGAENSEDHYMMKYDEVLLPEWRKTVKATGHPQLNFLHLMGSHLHYHNRYPPQRARFTGADVLGATPHEWLDAKKAGTVADYDNSILYTDSILNEVIGTLRRSAAPEVMVYVSDHGENVYDDRDYWGRDGKYVRVPFLIYVNEAYRRKNPAIVADIERATARKFSTSELPQLLLHLSGSDYKLYDARRDVLSPQFVERRRYVDGNEF